MCKTVFRAVVVLILGSLAGTPARAQLAVIDVPAIVQLVQEVQSLQQQVQTAEAQLAQAQQALQTMTGGRGMQLLLGGTVRNYLPQSWPQLSGAMGGTAGTYPSLAADVRSALAANAILTPAQLASLSAAGQQQIAAVRRSGALQQALAGEALVNSSARFASLQTLINAISSATDQKGILDLQARIAAELGMLQNEQTKLQILTQLTLAQQSIERQQEREQIIAGQGSFAARFQPVP